ncbi:hypothetical protein IEZ26_08200 [Nocardioides cavernae]|uniref:DUF1129 family protein n=1 Tax=Nocardioides cavernae TaxID=1921566 RepID=A0ABR8N8Y1_9ACTN|nr:hypothetical protein [Nocardioides cavernae]MBD3924597.1 hypothetical protein [Nocardioides cavernae]MBM7515030.1 hypothetical protein [Nocardioides cavernae]
MRIDTNTPHVEDGWTQAFLLELRLRGVDGRRIGSALAEVEAHCAESGESARSAFGDPEAYAADLAPAPAPAPPDLARDVATSVLGLAGMLLTLAAIGAWSSGTEVELTTGFLAVSALVVLGTVLIVRLAEPLLRAVVKHWWVAVVGGGAPIALFVAVLVTWRQTVVSAPVLPSLVAGLALLAVHTAVTLHGPDLADPVVGPEGAGGTGTMREGTLSRGLDRIGPWLFPVLTAVMAIPLLLL